MSNEVLVINERVQGEIPDLTFELIGKGRELAQALGGSVSVAMIGDLSSLDAFGGADKVYTVEHPVFGSGYSAQAWEEAVAEVVAVARPKVVLFGTGTIGIDLAGSIAYREKAPLASYVVDLKVEGSDVVAVSQLYGGKLLAESLLEGETVVATVIAGSFPSEAGRSGGSPEVVSVAAPKSLDSLTLRPVAVKEPEKTGVDITAADLLVSVGRGVGSQANIEMLQELADALKVPLSASRPVIDQGWLPKPHQVGKSGKKVKPKVYLAFGISGAPEHLEGMRSSEMIIACNTDPKAPIFEVAHYGTTLDLFDLVPEILEKLEA
jgi:electron transfer flavoprotein alpha subunit